MKEKKGKANKMQKVERFRHVSALIDTSIYIIGGFDQEMPTVPTDQILKLDLNRIFAGNPSLMTSLAVETGREVINHNTNSLRRSSGRENHYPATQQSRRNDHRIDTEPKRHNLSNQTNRSIRLCPEAIVANFKEQSDVQKISIDELESEPKKLNEQTINHVSRDNAGEVIAKYFLGTLFMKGIPELNYPLPIEYLDKLLIRMEKIFSE